MKKIVFTLMAFMGLSAYAQTDAILWKVTGKGLTKPTYIFGTIHITCGADKVLTPQLDSLLAKTDILATEINFTDPSEVRKIMASENEVALKKINELLTSSEFKTVDSLMQAIKNDTLIKYNNKSLMSLMSMFLISPQIVGCDKPEVIDLLITIKAYGQAKKMIGLDGFEFQKALLDSIPLFEQKQWLLDFCNNLEKSKQEFKALETAYYNQKSTQLYNISFKTNPEFAKYEDIFLTQRNTKWVKYLTNNMKTNSFFVAVGAAHLGGSNGLIALLKKQGYKLTPIRIR